MTSSLDDFENNPHELEAADDLAGRTGAKRNLLSAWKTSPFFKLFILLLAGAALATAAFGLFSKPADTKVTSSVSRNSNVSAVPGGQASPAYQKAVEESSRSRAAQAASQGGSALPTPVGSNLNAAGENETKNDPLAEFRRELERTQQAQQKRDEDLRHEFVQQQEGQTQNDNALTGAMKAQMASLINGWVPKAPQMLMIGRIDTNEDNGQKTAASEGASASRSAAEQASSLPPLKILIPAGTVSYGQMLIEANSDVPGPIMAQVLSGPLTGGRAIGSFETETQGQDLLIIRFRTVDLKGVDYPVDILALDPDTTLGGMATETDDRYFARLVLPAAAAFIQGFSQAFSQQGTTSSVSGDVVVQSQATNGLTQGLAQGGQSAAQIASGFLQQQGAQTKPLVRVAAGTALGLFFVESVAQDPNELHRRALLSGQTGGATGIAGLSGQTLPTTGTVTPTGYPMPYNPYAGNPYAANPNGSSNPYGTNPAYTPYGSGASPYGSSPYGAPAGGVGSSPNNNVVYLK